jgi:hypothetical protein
MMNGSTTEAIAIDIEAASERIGRFFFWVRREVR